MENRYAYDAFGNLLGQEEAFPNRILYAGQLYDQETGQYYLRARYYNPTIGRFSRRIPTGETGLTCMRIVPTIR